jgi:hypothetical protein
MNAETSVIVLERVLFSFSRDAAIRFRSSGTHAACVRIGLRTDTIEGLPTGRETLGSAGPKDKLAMTEDSDHMQTT